MKGIGLTEQQYYDKVYGGWMGKNIGGTLGVPLEGKKELMNHTFYPVLPDEPLENDDLDMQLVWLHALEQYGARLTAHELGREWVEHIFFPFDEYGYALANLRRGIAAPLAGYYNNPFKDCMGSPIRSEIWAMAAPGRPGVAAYYAYQDAIVDHAGGEGVWGEMFFAAIESAAFVESDRDKLLETGMSYIPGDSRTAKALRDLFRWHREGKSWQESRGLILQEYGSSNFTDAPQNIAFTVLGWLYGESFGDAILKAVNCGYDTDCTAATLGAILGIIGGRDSLPEEWIKPVGERVVVSPPVKGFPAPKDLDELTRRTMEAAVEVAAVWKDAEPRFEEYHIPPTAVRHLLPPGSRQPLGVQVTLDFGEDGPAIAPGETRAVKVTVVNGSREEWTGMMEAAVPEGWSTSSTPFRLAADGGRMEWLLEVTAAADIEPFSELVLQLHRIHDRQVWNIESVPFAFVAASTWLVSRPGDVDAKRVIVRGNRLNMAELADTREPGVYKAAAALSIPESREAKLIASTVSPVKVTLGKELVINGESPAEPMPAFHRSNPSRSASVQLAGGNTPISLELTVEPNAVQDEESFVVHVIAVAPKQTAKPGCFYYYTDVGVKA